MGLKQDIKSHAYALGADLVGIGSVRDRCRHAPPMMSPQGLFPGARSVVVMALHHPDVSIELGGETHSQEIGTYSVQYFMNSRLDEMSYRMATFLEGRGHGAIPIVSSNIWRYNRYKELNAIFAPDVSHIYMAVVAGLADLGYNGLALTPEYGARNRFVTVITDAELEPDPLIPPGTVCDRCMLCRKHCPTRAFDEEVAGEKVVRIDPYEYRFPDKNLWRCAWGEHFDLDLDLDIPSVVTEEVILEQSALHGRRGGEMGQCLKFCLPKASRTSEPAYSRTPVRRLPTVTDEGLASRALWDRLLTDAAAGGGQYVFVHSAEELGRLGIDIEAHLPGARSAVTVAVARRTRAGGPGAGRADGMAVFGATYIADSLCLKLTRALEDLGFRSVTAPSLRAAGLPERILREAARMGEAELFANTVLTRKLPPPGGYAAGPDPVPPATPALTEGLCGLARSLGADLTGTAPVSRLREMAAGLRPIFDGEREFAARDRSRPFTPWEPEIRESFVRPALPEDILPGARSVFVFALRLHERVLARAGKPPAEAVGPFAFETYVTHWLGAAIGMRLVRYLEEAGYPAVLTADLMGTGSFAANPRGQQEDLFCNRFAALAAGLGVLTRSGHVATPQFGIRQRFIAVVTTAPLTESPLAAQAADLCAACGDRCVAACPVGAFAAEPASFDCEGRHFSFLPVERARCDWAKRYGLAAAEGFGLLGSPTDDMPPDTIDAEALGAALRRLDPIKKHRPVAADPCMLRCPYAASQTEGDG